jgi:hypothetical protein
MLLIVGLIGCASTGSHSSHRLQSAREIVSTASPAVVEIQAGDDRLGTGFIVDASGLVATNLHVIEGEAEIKVKLYKESAALPVMSIAGVDRAHDLALMWIKPPHALSAVRLGDSNAMSAGDKVYAIGNPLGDFAYSISDGLVSQVRQLSSDLTILQISAPISLGSSGGPLFNQYGEVIGVTTAIVTDGQNINLAVPTNYLQAMIRHPQAIALPEFARQTADLALQHGEASGSADDDNVEIRRQVPTHAISVLDGCSLQDIQDVVSSIAQAIEVGAPLYNKKTKQGYEACYRVYEGTALRYEHDAACKGVRSAFGDGLLRASSMQTYKEKAWAMRDTFDGLINVAKRWADQNHATLPVE